MKRKLCLRVYRDTAYIRDRSSMDNCDVKTTITNLATGRDRYHERGTISFKKKSNKIRGQGIATSVVNIPGTTIGGPMLFAQPPVRPTAKFVPTIFIDIHIHTYRVYITLYMPTTRCFSSKNATNCYPTLLAYDSI